jgi:DNA polymerase III gamma/tau subunit
VRSQAGQEGAPRKRVYDRKSGTGRGKEVKRGGGGAGNWGTENGDGKWDEKPVAEDIAKIEGETAEREQAAPSNVPQESEEQKKFREEEEKRIKEEEEKEAKLMGLADYNKKKAEERAKLPELKAVRQAGEGVDKKEAQKWASYTALSRKDDDDEKQELKKKEKKEAKKQSVSADLLNFQAKKPERERRDNKNSPKFNKDNNKQGAAKKRSGPAAPDVKDSQNFPALSTKA